MFLNLYYLLNCSNPYVHSKPTELVNESTSAANSFTDSVVLRNGQTLEKVKATLVADSVVVTDATGKTKVFSKKEILEVKHEVATNLIDEANVESNPSLSSSWSEYQGKLKWRDAKAKCESIGMRLASISELKAAYNAGITKSWKEAGFLLGSYYWSSTSSNEFYYYFDSKFGGNYDGISSDYNPGGSHDSVHNDSHFVRCIR